MERTIGMDVHAASCTLAVISQSGKRLRDFSGRDPRPGVNRSGPADSWRAASGFRGGPSERVAVRDAPSPRLRACGGRDHAEPWPEARQARRVRFGRRPSERKPRESGLQSARSVYTTARTLEKPYQFGRNCRARAGSDQEPVPLSRSLGQRIGDSMWLLGEGRVYRRVAGEGRGP